MQAALVDEAPPIPDFAPLKAAGLPFIDDQTIQMRYEQLVECRCKLEALLHGTGWTWDDVIQPYVGDRP